MNAHHAMMASYCARHAARRANETPSANMRAQGQRASSQKYRLAPLPTISVPRGIAAWTGGHNHTGRARPINSEVG
jgi:hypothetical protein